MQPMRLQVKASRRTGADEAVLDEAAVAVRTLGGAIQEGRNDPRAKMANGS